MEFNIGDHVLIRSPEEIDEVISDYVDYLISKGINRTNTNIDYFRNSIKINSGKEYIIKEIVPDNFDCFLRFEGNYSDDFRSRKVFSKFCVPVNSYEKSSVPALYGV